MVINALNSGSKVFMADFEDANSPTWHNNIDGQINLYHAVRGTITHTEGTKQYKLNPQIATLMVRPRGWHLEEAHVLIGGKSVSASMFDFGLYFFHNAKALLAKVRTRSRNYCLVISYQGSGPYFYLPKMESHLEARLWNDIFTFSEQQLGLSKYVSYMASILPTSV